MTSDQENFFVVGEIIEICPFVYVDSDAWNCKDDPKSYRQGVKLKDRANPPPNGKINGTKICPSRKRGLTRSGHLFDILQCFDFFRSELKSCPI